MFNAYKNRDQAKVFEYEEGIDRRRYEYWLKVCDSVKKNRRSRYSFISSKKFSKSFKFCRLTNQALLRSLLSFLNCIAFTTKIKLS